MTKRIVSFFLIVNLFYNVLGYYLLYHQQEEQNWVALMERQEPSKYKMLEINASLYSFVEDTDFEYVNENITVNNKHYHVFKKRIQNNILQLYYLPNSHLNAINTDLKTIVDQQLFDQSTNNDYPAKKLLKTFLTDYVFTNPIVLKSPPFLLFETAKIEQLHIFRTDCGYFDMPYSPPDIV